MELLENCFRGDGMGSLFHRGAFFRLHEDAPGLYFEGYDGADCQLCIHFTPQADGVWRSPGRGTYGGYATAAGLPLQAWIAAHRHIEQRLRERGARAIEILPAPMAHDAVAFANQCYVLSAHGYALERCDLNHSLAVDDRPLVERMSRGNAKRLRKCEREGLAARRLEPQALASVYEVLRANREARGYALSMSLQQLQQMQTLFPDRLLCFGCGDAARLAAGAVCLQLDARVLYVFYWGERPGFETHSPVVAVADAIYTHCRAAGLALLDVGTSTIGSEANTGLIAFKRHLGFEESLKLRFVRRFDVAAADGDRHGP